MLSQICLFPSLLKRFSPSVSASKEQKQQSSLLEMTQFPPTCKITYEECGLICSLQMLSNCKARTQRHRNAKDLLYGDTYKFAVQKILARMQKNVARLEAWETSFDSAAPRDRWRRNNKFKALLSLITEFSKAITTINTPASDWETFRSQMTKATQKVSMLLENDEKREYLRGLTMTANFGVQ